MDIADTYLLLLILQSFQRPILYEYSANCPRFLAVSFHETPASNKERQEKLAFVNSFQWKFGEKRWREKRKVGQSSTAVSPCCEFGHVHSHTDGLDTPNVHNAADHMFTQRIWIRVCAPNVYTKIQLTHTHTLTHARTVLVIYHNSTVK